MRIWIRKGRPKPANVPWWVWLGVSTKYGGTYSRGWAIWNAWMTALISLGALIVAFFREAPERYLILSFGLCAIPFALWRWLAIRWLDRRKAEGVSPPWVL
jgi:hypothetical protein